MVAGANRQLSRAIENGDLAGVRSALDAGAHPDFRGPYGERPLTAAVVSPRGTHLVRALLQQGARVELMNAVWQTPLMIAAAQGRLPIARLLLETGANPNRVTCRSRERAMRRKPT
jgi:ankyrin repeat protein